MSQKQKHSWNPMLLLLFLTVPGFCQEPGQEIAAGNIFNAERLQAEKTIEEKSQWLPEDLPLFHSRIFLQTARDAGLHMNAVSHRKPHLQKDGARFQRVYFSYDSNLVALVHFFELLETRMGPLSVEALTMSARRRLKAESNPGGEPSVRLPLTGNCIVALPENETALDRLSGLQTEHPISGLLLALTRNLPRDSYLTSLSLRGTSLKIQGISSNPMEAAGILAAAEFLDSPTPATSQRDGFVVKGEVRMDLLPRY